jgi:membrane-bound lytic murein transglycosylase B
MIVALWGIESNFGGNTGGFDVIPSLATLAYDGRRAAFFRRELLAALRALDDEKIDSSLMRGSWAGAMGQCQFMPTTYLRHAVDHDGDGRRDIWDNEADVFASIANYLVAEGWQGGRIWGREVRLKRPLPPEEIGLENRRGLAEWSKKGVQTPGGRPLPVAAMEASLIQPDGPGGRSFLVYDNFRALMRWNRSTYFAVSAGLLADRLR